MRTETGELIALELDLEAAGVGSIIWATGFTVDYGWLQVDALDANGKPRHQRRARHRADGRHAAGAAAVVDHHGLT